ncbi:hypothetical protein ACF8C6_09045 [Pseudomonas sp. zbq_18]|uniref:phage adaptor protein n=1 Tax=Pseudomonas sp. zbq_18 TaxID=3367251 RepID=UPI00370A529E
MTLDELEKDFRTQAQDEVAPYLFDKVRVAAWLIEAEQEACIRGRLLHESDDATVCEVPVSAGQSSYKLHPALYEIDHLRLLLPGCTERRAVKLVSQEWLNEHLNGWRDRSGAPEYAIQNDTSLRLVPKPDADGSLLLEGYRLPLRGLSTSGTSKPEIHTAHHRHLVHWALFRAFSTPDPEMFDQNRAALSERIFTAYFGERPDADLRRLTQEDGPHHNKAWV